MKIFSNMTILGISDVTGNHSHSSIALIRNGHLKFALSQERQSRIKNDPQFPAAAVQTGLDYLGIKLSDLDAAVCAYPPPRYYAGLLSHGAGDVFRTVGSILAHRPYQLLRYLYPNVKKAIFDPHCNGLLNMGIPDDDFHFIDHHLAHVTAAYSASPFENALALSYGGFAPHADGTNAAGAVYRCRGSDIQWIADIPMCAAGCWFSGITVALGFRYMQQESKTMGLAALGDPDVCYEFCSALSTRYRSGEWQRYSYWLDYILSPRKPVFMGSHSGRGLKRILVTKSRQDLAAAAQCIWQENILSFVRDLVRRYSIGNLILSGGTFQNIIVNTALAHSPGIDAVYVHPHPGDGSTPIGAALQFYQRQSGILPRAPLYDTGLGCEFNDPTIEHFIKQYKNRLQYKKIQQISEYTASRLSEDRIIGWFQGREEYGSRSLGHRCILAAPKGQLRDIINMKIKKREDWIPLGVSCLTAQAGGMFEQFVPSPYASFRFQFKPEYRSQYESILHRDGTVRVHSVNQNTFQPFHQLLQVFYRKTGHPLILNSSLNRHGMPIVHTPDHALELLLTTQMDELIIGSYSVRVRADNI